MVRIAADLTRLFTDLPLPARFTAARSAGFEGVSLPNPYDGPVQELRDRLVLAGLGFAAMQAPPPNYTGAAPGFAATPGGEERFARDFKRMMRYAEVLKPAAIELLPGPEGDMAAFETNLRRACAEAPKRMFLLCPRPGEALLPDFAAATRLRDTVGAANLALGLETATARALGLSAEQVWAAHGSAIGHVSLSDEPEASEIGALLARLGAEGYAGFVSADYTPAKGTEASLGWLPAPTPAPGKAGKKKRK